jgi:hypothetical protein
MARHFPKGEVLNEHSYVLHDCYAHHVADVEVNIFKMEQVFQVGCGEKNKVCLPKQLAKF